MLVMIGMECSGEIRRAFQALGHEAYSVDLKPAEDGCRDYHIEGDVFDVVELLRPELAIFHPVCQWLSVSGIHWNNRGRNGLTPEQCWQKTAEAERDFMRCTKVPVKKKRLLKTRFLSCPRATARLTKPCNRTSLEMMPAKQRVHG